jgi:hypothetical protein
MAFTGNFFCTSAKQGFLTGSYAPTAVGAVKIALYTDAASLTAATTAYNTTGEVSSTGTNYVTGGNTLTGAVINSSGTTAYLDFTDTSWANATFTARGALIYMSATNAAIAVLDFGSDKTASAGTFTVVFPNANATEALIRIA